MTKISDAPNQQRKQTLPGAFSFKGAPCTLCKVGPHSVTKLCQQCLRHRVFILPMSVLAVLLAAEPTFPTSGTSQTLTTGWSRSESTDLAAQWSSSPRQQQESQHWVERRQNTLVTLSESVLPPYTALSCKSAQAAMEQSSWAWPLLPHTHFMLFKSFRGLGRYLQVLLLQDLFPSQSWRWTSLFPTVKHQSKTFFFSPQPLQLHLQDSTPEWECCRAVMAKIITERVSNNFIRAE